MSQDMLPGQITAVAAADLVRPMSLFSMGGRFNRASLSDYIGRKNTYFVFMVIGFIANVCVKAIDKRHHMTTDAEPEPADALDIPGSAQAVPAQA